MILCENIGLRYDDGPEILRNIDLEIEAGSFHFLTGGSGAGKTSLLRLLSLAHRPHRGNLHIFGQDISKLGPKILPMMRRQIGVIYQEFRLIDHLSVYENVALPLMVTGQREAHYRNNILELLDWVGLGHHKAALPPTLSGGEKQRTAIARAVITSPRLIVADEPTGNVDPELGIRLLRLLDELNKMGTTIIVATHDAHIWQNFDHPRLHLADGEIHMHHGETA